MRHFSLFNPLQPPVQLHVSILEIAVNAVHEPNNQKRPDQPISYGRVDGFFIGIRHFNPTITVPFRQHKIRPYCALNTACLF